MFKFGIFPPLLATPDMQQPSFGALGSVLDNHVYHNQDALLALTGLPSGLFLFEQKKTAGIFSRTQSLSIGSA